MNKTLTVGRPRSFRISRGWLILSLALAAWLILAGVFLLLSPLFGGVLGHIWNIGAVSWLICLAAYGFTFWLLVRS